MRRGHFRLKVFKCESFRALAPVERFTGAGKDRLSDLRPGNALAVDGIEKVAHEDHFPDIHRVRGDFFEHGGEGDSFPAAGGDLLIPEVKDTELPLLLLFGLIEDLGSARHPLLGEDKEIAGPLTQFEEGFPVGDRLGRQPHGIECPGGMVKEFGVVRELLQRRPEVVDGPFHVPAAAQGQGFIKVAQNAFVRDGNVQRGVRFGRRRGGNADHRLRGLEQCESRVVGRRFAGRSGPFRRLVVRDNVIRAEGIGRRRDCRRGGRRLRGRQGPCGHGQFGGFD